MGFKVKKPKVKIPTVKDVVTAVKKPQTLLNPIGTATTAGLKAVGVPTSVAQVLGGTLPTMPQLLGDLGKGVGGAVDMGTAPVGSVAPLAGAGTGTAGSEFAKYVEGLKQQPQQQPFAVGPIAAQQIASNPLLGQQSQFQPQQAQIANLLMQRAQGQGGPSPAELMLAQKQDQIRNMALAQAASTSGRSMGAAQRQIGQQQALGAQEAVRNAAILRAQEQQAAFGDASKALEAGRSAELMQRGQDVQALSQDQQTALDAQKAAATLGLQGQTEAAKLNAQRDALVMQGSQAGLQDQTSRDLQGQKLQADIAMQEFLKREEAKQAEANRKAAMAGAVIGGVAGGAASYLGGK